MARAFAEKEVKPRAAEIDSIDEFPAISIVGWRSWSLAMTLPEQYGGAGADTVR